MLSLAVLGRTNAARTQIAEGFLRHLTKDRAHCTLFIRSGGIHHEPAILPLTVQIMRECNIDISSQYSKTNRSITGPGAGYDCVVCFPDDLVVEEEEEGSLLARNTLPSHWTAATPKAHYGRQWRIISAENRRRSHQPIPSEPREIRKKFNDKFEKGAWNPRCHFQDDYAGEPLWLDYGAVNLMRSGGMRSTYPVAPLITRHALESEGDYVKRFREARDAIHGMVLATLQAMEGRYNVKMLK